MMGRMSRSRRPRGSFAALRRFARHGLAGALVAGGLLLVAAFGAIAVQGNAVARDASAVQSEIARLEADLALKRGLIADRQTDQYLIDRSRDLGYVRPHEALVTVQREVQRVAESAVAPAPGRLARWVAVFTR